MPKYRTLEVFSNYADAALTKSFLESEGIQVFIPNENFQILYMGSLGGFELKVEEDYYDKAKKLLIEIKTESVSCPNCESTDVYPNPENRTDDHPLFHCRKCKNSFLLK